MKAFTQIPPGTQILLGRAAQTATRAGTSDLFRFRGLVV